MLLSKVEYRNSHFIRIAHIEHRKIEIQVAKMSESFWCDQFSSWLVPYTKDAYTHLKTLSNDIQIDNQNLSSQQLKQKNKRPVTLHVGTQWLYLHIPKNQTDITFIRSITNSRWSSTHFRWEVPNNKRNYNLIIQYFSNRDIKEIVHTKIISTQKQIAVESQIEKNTTIDKRIQAMIHRLEELRYSSSTIRTYQKMFIEFADYYKNRTLNDLQEIDIHAYLHYLVHERKVSASYQNQAINAIKFYFEKVLQHPRTFYTVDRPKKEKMLPTVLSMQEVKRLIEATTNIKHKCILMLAYSSGLRVGEICRLKPEHIDKTRMQICVKQAKGKKDRMTILSRQMLNYFKVYYRHYHPVNYIFEGAKGVMYTASSMQKIVRKSAKNANITKRVTMHTLRHTFATHCLENGIDLRYIQSMLGHESPKTTEIYTHVTTKGFDQIKSPLDLL